MKALSTWISTYPLTAAGVLLLSGAVLFGSVASGVWFARDYKDTREAAAEGREARQIFRNLEAQQQRTATARPSPPPGKEN